MLLMQWVRFVNKVASVVMYRLALLLPIPILQYTVALVRIVYVEPGCGVLIADATTILFACSPSIKFQENSKWRLFVCVPMFHRDVLTVEKNVNESNLQFSLLQIQNYAVFELTLFYLVFSFHFTVWQIRIL